VPLLSEEDRRLALSLVRRAVELFVREGRRLEPEETAPFFSRREGVFVTLTVPEGLRGCVGTVESRNPLAESLVHCAIAAATQDTRFAPVSESELPRLAYEISILSTLRRADSPEEVQAGIHGVLVESGGRRGLLLPQVAAAHRWDRETFLDQVCMKAGLPAEAWRGGAALWLFTAEVFGEGNPEP
jgi:AmmeMemoRadiSam system protein A